MTKNKSDRLFRVTWGKYYKGDPILSTTHGTEDIAAPSAGDAIWRAAVPSNMDWSEAKLKSEE